jgi:rubrerythrin
MSKIINLWRYRWVCPNCGFWTTHPEPYCPKCGAEMCQE